MNKLLIFEIIFVIKCQVFHKFKFYDNFNFKYVSYILEQTLH